MGWYIDTANHCQLGIYLYGQMVEQVDTIALEAIAEKACRIVAGFAHHYGIVL